MIVRNLYIDNPSFLADFLIRTIIGQGDNYVLIKNEDSLELHFNNHIYRIYSIKNNIEIVPKEAALDILNLKYSDEDMNLVNISKKQIRPGFKKYTKKMMKADKYKYGKINVKGCL